MSMNNHGGNNGMTGEDYEQDDKLHIVKCMLNNGYANVTADHVRKASWYYSTQYYTEPNGEFNECGWETNRYGEPLINGETNAQFNARMGMNPLPKRPQPTVEANRDGKIVLNGETNAEFNKRIQSL